MTPIFLRPTVRPFLILVGVVLLLAAIDAGNGRFLTVATAYSALQSFSTFALVALGLGLTMLIGEFDLSIAGVFGLAGCVALTTGAENAEIGLLCAVGVGAAFGFAARARDHVARLGIRIRNTRRPFDRERALLRDYPQSGDLVRQS